MLAVANSHAQIPSMQSDSNTLASPRPQQQKRNTRPRNTRGPNQTHQDALSDSNLPGAYSPSSRKPQKPRSQGDRATSMAMPPSNPSDAYQQRTRPASVAVPNPAALATPSKAAYAGATFQSSPAPSSLPVPKFFSKSVPAANPASGFKARLAKEIPRSGSPESDSNSLAPPTQRSETQSPLDFMFKADREERLKQNGNGQNNNLLPSGSQTPTRPKEMFTMEMDDSDSPAARRAQKAASQPQAQSPFRRPTQPSDSPYDKGTVAQRNQNAAYTKSLKDLLKLSTDDMASGQTPPAGQHTQPSLFDGQSSPSSPFAQSSQPQTPQYSTPQQDRVSQYQHDLHYGNRNLSPLFQAARNETPQRPSPLKQQVSPHMPGVQQQSQYPQFQPPQSQPYPRSPQHQYQQASPFFNHQQPPQANFTHHQPYPGQHAFPPSPSQNHQRGAPDLSGSNASDVKSMEDNLRRILKLS